MNEKKCYPRFTAFRYGERKELIDISKLSLIRAFWHDQHGRHRWSTQNCYNGSRIITQSASIIPSDLGTLRKSRMSITAIAECSHVNNSAFTKKSYDPNFNDSYIAYQFGTSDIYSYMPEFQNATVVAMTRSEC